MNQELVFQLVMYEGRQRISADSNGSRTLLFDSI
jgi:hypothetical protein